MDLYKRRNLWKRVLFVAALLIVAISLYYTNQLARSIAEQEVRKVEAIATAYDQLNIGTDEELTQALEVIRSNEMIPVIWATSSDEIYGSKNFDSLKIARNPNYLSHQLEKLKRQKSFIEMDYIGDDSQYLYYRASDLLIRLRMYPYFQLGLIGIFLLVSYFAFSSSRKAEQNRVWVGLAKETAHQLGTPISSLSAWMDLLKEYEIPQEAKELIDDMNNDVGRLELVAERFSKIGSKAELLPLPLFPLVEHVVNYMRRRASHNVEIALVDECDTPLIAQVNPPLLDWVLENLIKNALDAMNGVGMLEIRIKQSHEYAVIDVKDSGKGIPRSKFSTVFEPGYSTKKRGWGLGLTLTKRIIHHYHKGKIFVKESSPQTGTTFRILLRKK